MTARIFTNLTTRQYADLTRWCTRNDRSISYAVSRAVTDHLGDVEPYRGDAGIKVMSRTTQANATAVKARGGIAWRWINACVQEMLDNA